ncbi:caspase family protein [Polyangium sp. 6x1]|uniref:caspase family protein n=1 Tax=Polyangium sp. 6x1 TaxID=3042689 RepID=UPI00248252A5|nr:caspase family protein [Polyangium sp. 6x1]MDI1442454.1 caspase family protein [Polyangium sp. 6x1]
MIHAVIVGIDAYQDASIPRLSCARSDARALHGLLERRIPSGERNVVLLEDERATRRNIMATIGDELPSIVEAGDTVLLYFACHGSPERRSSRDRRSLYLIPHDTDYQRIYATAIDMDRDVPGWLERLSEAGAKLVVLLLDTCFSGAAGGRTFTGPVLQSSPKIPGYLEFDDPDPLTFRDLDLGQGQAIFSAADRDQVAMENLGVGHGVFTYHLLKALTKKRDGARTVHLGVLYAEVCDDVRTATGERQEPVLSTRLKNARLPCLA